ERQCGGHLPALRAPREGRPALVRTACDGLAAEPRLPTDPVRPARARALAGSAGRRRARGGAARPPARPHRAPPALSPGTPARLPAGDRAAAGRDDRALARRGRGTLSRRVLAAFRERRHRDAGGSTAMGPGPATEPRGPPQTAVSLSSCPDPSSAA